MIEAILREYWLIIKNKLWGWVLDKPPKGWSKGKRGLVVLLPGINENWMFLRTIGRNLNKKGYRIYYPEGVNTKDKINRIAGAIAADLKNEKEIKAVIGHSKGGLVAKYLVDNYPEIRINRVITIATPWGGTIWAWLPLNGLKELKPGSKILEEIRKKENNIKKIHCLYSKWDNHVVPNRNLVLDGAENKKTEVVGHTNILEDEETIKTIGGMIKI